MEIDHQISAETAILTVRGRLDAAWSGPLADALQKVIRDGLHQVHLNFSGVSYVSSAGIRVLLANWKELRRVQGRLAVIAPSAEVERVLKMAGLAVLLEASAAVATPAALASATDKPRAQSWSGPGFSGEIEELVPGARWRGRLIGSGALEAVKLPASTLALGLGAFGNNDADCASRLGELLAVGGCAVCLPADGANQPDYALTEGSLAPEARVAQGLVAEGAFASQARFEASGEAGAANLSDLIAGLLTTSGYPQIAFAAVVESAALVGACLRRVPTEPEAGKIFEFPAVRDWLTFTTEPAYQNTVALLTGVAVRDATGPLAGFTRPSGAAGGPRLHLHAAAFPYRPVRHGQIELAEALSGLFETGRILGVLHLLSDNRPGVGAGESRFYRGACWFGPLDI